MKHIIWFINWFILHGCCVALGTRKIMGSMRGWGTYFSLIQTKNSSCVEAFKVWIFAFYAQVATYW